MKRPRLNEKRRKLLKGLAEGKNVSEAGRAAGYLQRQDAHRALNRIAQTAPEILESIGLGADKVLTNLGAKLEARETKFFVVKGRIQEREVYALDIQLRAAQTLAKLHGLYPADRLTVTVKGDLGSRILAGRKRLNERDKTVTP